MYKFVLDDSNVNYDIYINNISSSAKTYLSRHPHVFSLIRELLPMHKLQGSSLVIEHDMGRNIGMTDVVLTTDKDTIYYAKPIKSEVYTRFAKNRNPQASRYLTAVLNRDDDGNYEISDIWIGKNHPSPPDDINISISSKLYWEKHAFVQGARDIQIKSLTKDCPY